MKPRAENKKQRTRHTESADQGSAACDWPFQKAAGSLMLPQFNNEKKHKEVRADECTTPGAMGSACSQG